MSDTGQHSQFLRCFDILTSFSSLDGPFFSNAKPNSLITFWGVAIIFRVIYMYNDSKKTYRRNEILIFMFGAMA